MIFSPSFARFFFTIATNGSRYWQARSATVTATAAVIGSPLISPMGKVTFLHVTPPPFYLFSISFRFSAVSDTRRFFAATIIYARRFFASYVSPHGLLRFRFFALLLFFFISHCHRGSLQMIEALTRASYYLRAALAARMMSDQQQTSPRIE